jgi:hypothetical protein
VRLALGLALAAVGCAASATAPSAPPPAPAPLAAVDAEAAALVERLGSDDAFEREEAQRRLETMGERARDAIIPALESPDPEVRWRAECVRRAVRLDLSLRRVRLAFALGGKLHVADLPFGAPRAVDDAPTCFDWTADGRLLAGRFHGLYLEGRRLRGWDYTTGADWLFLSPTRRHVAVVTSRQSLAVVDLEDESAVELAASFHPDGFDAARPPLAWIDDHRLVATWREGREWVIRRYDASRRTSQLLFSSETAWIRSFAVHGDRVAAIVRPHRDTPHALALVLDRGLRILRAESRDVCLMNVAWTEDGALRTDEIVFQEEERALRAIRQTRLIDPRDGALVADAEPDAAPPTLTGGIVPLWVGDATAPALLDEEGWLHEAGGRRRPLDNEVTARPVVWRAWRPAR